MRFCEDRSNGYVFRCQTTKGMAAQRGAGLQWLHATGAAPPPWIACLVLRLHSEKPILTSHVSRQNALSYPDSTGQERWHEG